MRYGTFSVTFYLHSKWNIKKIFAGPGNFSYKKPRSVAYIYWGREGEGRGGGDGDHLIYLNLVYSYCLDVVPHSSPASAPVRPLKSLVCQPASLVLPGLAWSAAAALEQRWHGDQYFNTLQQSGDLLHSALCDHKQIFWIKIHWLGLTGRKRQFPSLWEILFESFASLNLNINWNLGKCCFTLTVYLATDWALVFLCRCSVWIQVA